MSPRPAPLSPRASARLRPRAGPAPPRRESAQDSGPEHDPEGWRSHDGRDRGSLPGVSTAGRRGSTTERGGLTRRGGIPGLEGLRWVASRQAVLATVLLAAVVAVILVMRASAFGPVPVADLVRGTSTFAPGPSGAPATTAGGAGAVPAASTSAVLVHVVGRVRAPGVVSLPLGARVRDAVAAAGGASAGADLGAVNLARTVVDGEQVRVPAPGETAACGATASVTGGGSSMSPGLVSLNTATEAQLDALPGVGPVLARRILDWRAAHGRFTAVDELGEVDGIGDSLLNRLRPLVKP